MSVMERDQKYIANTYARFPLVLTEGKGVRVKDENGKEYIDLGSGIAVNTFGYVDEYWARAVSEQLTKLQHTSNLYYTEPAVALAQTLCERTGMKKVFFSNSGAEANECAIKAARKYFADKYEGKRKTIITLTNSFHGRTITTLAATGQAAFHQDFLPLTEGFVYADPTVESLKGQLNRGDIGAILFEVVQGEGGVLPLTQEFVDFMRDIAQKDDILLIADEVQIGNGRSGQLFGYMHYNLTPDIVSTAKGLGGGLPLGATLLGEKVKDVLGAGSHGSTFGGNPVCCAGALSVINRIDDDLLKEVREKSAYIIEELSNAKGVKSISGLGLMLGIETAADASEVIKKCMDKGVLVIKAKHKVRLLPALNIPWEDLKTAVD
ncbi:MAG TPA: acetylornithine/succinylornithine family transaminase, partial [Clostridiales bacterium]|nr:acetylornithine/succinylornithine family transaminase [Clostridiales bacterium]